MKAMISLLKTGGIVLLMALLFLPVSVCAQSTETLTFTFNMSDFTFETDAQGQVFVTSAKHDLVYGDDLAKPAIPYRTVSMLAKPDEVYSNVTFSYSGAVKKTNVRLAPNPEKVEVGTMPNPVPLASYPNGLYPATAERGYFLMQGLMDGHRILNFQFSPFRYNSSTKELTLYTTVTMEVTTKKASYEVPESKGTMSGIVSSLVENAEKEEAYYPGSVPSAGTFEWGDGYLIICPESLREAFEPLRQWKMEKGLYAMTCTLEDIYGRYEGESESVKIKRCIQDYYLHHGLKYVLLGWNGDKGPIVYAYPPSGWEYGRIPTDWFYACLDDSEEFAFDWDADGDGILGNTIGDVDLYPEVVVSRAPVETVEEAAVFVNKILAYEQNPPTGDWYNDILLTGVRLWEPDEGPRESEVQAKRLYKNFIEPYFEADTQTLFGDKYFDSKDEPTCLDVEEFQSKVEEGFHIVYLTAHGETKLFCLSAKTGNAREDRELYGISHAMQMQSSIPSIFVTLSCWTQAFDTADNLARHFLINPNNGVFAYFGSTRPCYMSLYNIHGALFKGLLETSNTKRQLGLSYTMAKMSNVDDELHTFMFNMDGDPETRVYLSAPKQFANMNILLSGGKIIVDAGVENCTFAVRYSYSSRSIYKREYKENVRTYEIPVDEVSNCEITLQHDDYIPFTFTVNPQYIQNVTYSGTMNISGDVIVAGREVTNQKPIGNVIIQSGKTTFSVKKGVFLAPGFEVKKGASFEVKITK